MATNVCNIGSTSSSDSDLDMSTATKWFLLNIKTRRFDARPINKQRTVYGEYYHLFNQIKAFPTKFFEYLQMTPETFNYILSTLLPHLETRQYHFFHHAPIEIEERLVITLRFLATGSSFKSLAFAFRMGGTTVAAIVNEICGLLWDVLQPVHMKQPSQEAFKKIAEEFDCRWQFPNCIGALDGKHIRIKCPKNRGSIYYKDRKNCSIVLQGLVDARCRFILIDVGAYGKQSDDGTFQASMLSKLMDSDSLNIPPDANLPNSDMKLPFMFIADEAYPLKRHIMKPYSRRSLNDEEEMFNKRLSRARKTVECSFGIIAAKWRILLKPIETSPESAEIIVKAICILHNTVIDKEGPILDISEASSVGVQLAKNRRNNRPSQDAMNIRAQLTTYFVNNPVPKEEMQ